MKRRIRLLGMSIKQFGGITLCVVLSVLILIFGNHDVSQIETSVGSVEAKYEAEDGDLDFGGIMPGKQDEQDASSINEISPTAIPNNYDETAGTEANPLLLEDECFYYSVVQGVATVSELKNATLEEMTIPNMIEQYPVEIIGEYLFQNCMSLKRINIPEGIKEIRWNAFENCEALEMVRFPMSLTKICECAFWNTGLTSVALPEHIRTIEDYAFYSCPRLTELTLSFTSSLDMIFDMTIVDTVTLMEGVTVIDEDAFSCAESLANINLPSTLTMIKPYAFWECTALESIVLPDNVASIGANAFENCYGLKEVKMPEGLLLLSEYAFYSCWALEELVLPAGITTIQDSAFDDCEQLTLIVTEGSVGEEYVLEHDLPYEVR